jgi:hypothetical protein
MKLLLPVLLAIGALTVRLLHRVFLYCDFKIVGTTNSDKLSACFIRNWMIAICRHLRGLLLAFNMTFCSKACS